jgi:serine/threonine-protein kinase
VGEGGGPNGGAPRLIGGRYELEALVGKGGIGEVWRARHVALNSRVAIKFLQLAAIDGVSAQRRFTVEAQVTAQLKTPYAVQVFDFGITEEGQPYLVMELLEGETLGRRLERRKRLRVADTVKLLGQAARALQHAHTLGIVHRDFKPDNIVIVKDDEGREQIKVLDFGIAKLANTLEDEVSPDSTLPDGRVSFTKTGTVLGTPLYMAPEQIHRASDVDLRADIWAFGIVAFECLTGVPPYNGNSILELFARIESGQHLRASVLDRRIPKAFDAWFAMACAADRSQRFSDVSVAWKQLTVALDVSKGGLSLSTSLPADAGVGSAPHATRSSGAKLEVLQRSHDGGELKLLQRIPMRSTPPATPVKPDEGSASPLASSLADTEVMPARGRRSVRGWMIGAAASAILAGLFLWRWLAVPAPRAGARSASAAALSAAPSATAARAQTYRLQVASTPTGAEVYGNGALLGHTPLATALAASAHALHLEVRAPGYEAYTSELEATHDVQLVAQLAPVPAKPAPDTARGRPRSAVTAMQTGPAAPATTRLDGPRSVAPSPPPVTTALASPATSPPPPKENPLDERQ